MESEALNIYPPKDNAKPRFSFKLNFKRPHINLKSNFHFQEKQRWLFGASVSLGVIALVAVISATFPLRDRLFSQLNPKPESQAAEEEKTDDTIRLPPTYDEELRLERSKPEQTGVWINNVSVLAANPLSIWEKSVPLVLGVNRLVITYRTDEETINKTETILIQRHGLGDINGDGEVNVFDAGIISKNYGKIPGEETQGENLLLILSDFNKNKKIDVFDMGVLTGHLGQKYTYVDHTAAGTTPAPLSSPGATAPSNSIKVGQGFTDATATQIVRTKGDRVYLFAPQSQHSKVIAAYWAPQTSTPTKTLDFNKNTSVTDSAEVISTTAVYDNTNFVHVLVINQSGQIKDYPFDLANNQFKTAITIATGSPTIQGDYIGTGGVTGMVDPSGTLHIAYWSTNQHITYRAYTYNSFTHSLNQTSGPTQLDTAGKASHPVLALSPSDTTVTVAWISEATTPAHVLTRTRNATGEKLWNPIETASGSDVAVWHSTSSGINTDQGPSLVIDSEGHRHIVYIEDVNQSTDYGVVHYAYNNGDEWVDTAIPNMYTHSPVLAINAAGEIHLLSHGHSRYTGCTSKDQLCFRTQKSLNDWSSPTVFASAPNGESFDTSISIKQTIGTQRPESIEYVFFSALGGNYNTTSLYYGRIGADVLSIQAPTPTSALNPTAVPTQAAAASKQWAMRFNGNGTKDIDRVKIRIDAPSTAADIGNSDMTIDFWMKAFSVDNSDSLCEAGNDNWTRGNSILDRDVHGDGDFGDYGISLFSSGLAFGVSFGDSSSTICGVKAVNDGKWHHVAVTRLVNTGVLTMYVDGKQDAQGPGPRGDIRYRDNRSTSWPNDPYLVIGAEKHDTGSDHPAYNGLIDELRLSTTNRYTEDFSKPTAQFTLDAHTAALYHFSEGGGTTLVDSADNGSGGSPGSVKYGGAPGGPLWVNDTPF